MPSYPNLVIAVHPDFAEDPPVPDCTGTYVYETMEDPNDWGFEVPVWRRADGAYRIRVQGGTYWTEGDTYTAYWKITDNNSGGGDETYWQGQYKGKVYPTVDSPTSTPDIVGAYGSSGLIASGTAGATARLPGMAINPLGRFGVCGTCCEGCLACTGGFPDEISAVFSISGGCCAVASDTYVLPRGATYTYKTSCVTIWNDNYDLSICGGCTLPVKVSVNIAWYLAGTRKISVNISSTVGDPSCDWYVFFVLSEESETPFDCGSLSSHNVPFSELGGSCSTVTSHTCLVSAV